MSRSRHLNERQTLILEWIADGCPEDTDLPQGYKHTARSLEGHGLVKIKGRGKTWQAQCTPRGLRVLDGEEALFPSDERESYEDLCARINAEVRKQANKLREQYSYEDYEEPEIPDPKPFLYDYVSPRVEITTSFARREFIVKMDGTTRRAAFPPKDEVDYGLVEWKHFVAVVAAATHRKLQGIEGEDQWWVINVAPNEFIDVLSREQPDFSMRMIESKPEGWDATDKIIKWKCVDGDFRVADGYYPNIGPDRCGWQSLGGISTNSRFDLYDSLQDTSEIAFRDGLLPQGLWVGRLITGPENGEFRMELRIPTRYKRPALPKVSWT